MAQPRPERTWDPIVDYAMMHRNVRGFMSLFQCDKPVVCKVHGFCVAGGTDKALCSDRPSSRTAPSLATRRPVSGAPPTTSLLAPPPRLENAKRLLFTGDSVRHRGPGLGPRDRGAAPAELDARFEALVERIARMPLNQLEMMKLLVNEARRRRACTPRRPSASCSTASPATPREGYAFQSARPSGVQASGARARRPYDA